MLLEDELGRRVDDLVVVPVADVDRVETTGELAVEERRRGRVSGLCLDEPEPSRSESPFCRQSSMLISINNSSSLRIASC